MLTKLIKYDLKWLLKIIIVFYILGISFGVLGRLVDLLPKSIFFTILSGILKGISCAMVINSIVNTIIRSWVRFTNNLYKDESYLIHTLPIKKQTHLLSKVPSSTIVMGISVLVTAVSLIIMYLNKDTIEFLKITFNIISNSLNGSVTLLIILMVIVIFLEFVFIMLCGYFGIVFGYSFNKKKLVKSFIFGYISFFIASIFSLLVFLFSSIFVKEIYDLIFTTNIPELTFGLGIGIMLVGTVLYLLYILGIYLIINKKLNKGVNVD